MTNCIDLVIDENKCIHCGLCVKDCTAGVLEQKENEVPHIAENGEKRCIKCQHCLAVCPTGALSIFGKNPQDSDSIKSINSEEVLNLIKSRRSFRHYKSENLDKETMDKLKNMLNWVPTGCNNHRLHFAFIDDIAVMNDFRGYVTSTLIKILTKTPVKPILDKFGKHKDAILNGEDVIFRGAPHLIVACSPIDALCADIDPVIALSYFELYAQSLGVGTVWCGFAEICLKMFPELCHQLQIPDGYKASYVMLFGPRDIKYSRTTQPEPYTISVAQKGGRNNMNLIEKAKRYFWNFIR